MEEDYTALRKAKLEKRLARLSTKKQSLLEQRLRGESENTPGRRPLQEATASSADQAARPLRPISRQGNLPLSFAQQRLWFLDQLEPNSAFYNIPAALRLTGRLDLAALEQSLNEIVRRHEALRTTFGAVEGQAVQIIAPALQVALPVLDLGDLPLPAREAQARRLAGEEARRPFDLARGPLVRAAVLHLAADEHVLLLNVHHIVSDGWSMDILTRELAALYQSFSVGRSANLPELPIQYADFAVWQRDWLTGKVLEAQLGYWKQQLSGNLPVLELPTDHPRPAAQTFRGATHAFRLSAQLTEALQALSRAEESTLFMTLLAAFQTLLHRYTGQRDLIVGMPIANRNRAEMEGLIGFFVNILALRVDLSGNPTFGELLRRVREATLGAYEHQDLPFEMLVEELHLDRDLSRTPLFQVMFALQNTPMTEQALPGLTLKPLDVDNQTAKFDLTLFLTETTTGLSGAFEYNIDLFDAATIARMAAHFEQLLQGIAADPDQRLSALPLLTKAEQQQILVEWNDTRRDYPRARCVHELFELQVKQTPDAIAVVFEDRHLTYRELNQRANQLAHFLSARGVGPEVLVGLCLERSPEMVIGLLGILKASGAYVPLDPAQPAERLAFMLQDIQTPIVVTQHRLVDVLSSTQIPHVCLDRDWDSLAQSSTANPSHRAMPQNLAYVIYTSGSTGQPKGVPIEHASLLNLVSWHQRVFAVSAEDRATQLAGLGFDAAVWEMWPYLTRGASLHLPDEDTRLSPVQLQAWLVSEAITLSFLPTPLAESILVLPWPDEAPLRLLLTGGDRLHAYPSPALRFGLINNYGPTENTVVTTFGRVMPQVQADSLPTIGRPITNTQVYVLDEQLQPTPIGVVGELYIGGEGLARGYLNRPDLTAEKFVPNPYAAASMPGARLYQTGDLVRYRADGNIEFLGRRDFQVKVRGFRIELGEIEAVLNQHSNVQASAVIAHATSSDKRLVAYVAPKSMASLTVDELRRYLHEHLPDYMLPAAFVVLEALPLNSNGKVDRRALPAPDTARPVLAQAYVAPRTPTQELLASIWRDILKLERVGLYDNFFELGGHSLLATQIVSRVQSIFQLELPLRALFEAPTIAGLAERLEADRRKVQQSSILPLLPVSRPDNLPLSFAQQRLWFLDQLEPNSAFYNIPLALHLTGRLDLTAFERSFNEVVRRHASLRTTFAAVDGQAIQIIAPTLVLALPLIDLQVLPLSEREARVKQLATEEAQRPFNLTKGPLVRVSVLRLGSDEHVLLLNMHHIVSDGWSMNILIREWAALYAAFSQGQRSPLPELPIQYADFGVWQREWLQAEVLEAQLSYWQQQLGGVLPALELPTDHPRPALQTFRGARRAFQISQPLSQALQALSRQAGVTMFMTLLAAFQTLLQRYTGQLDIVVGTPIAGRNRTEIEDLIGFFVNTLVLRLDLSGNPTIQQMLQRAREVTLGAYAHQDMPFEMLVEALKPERDLSRSPLFQVMFAFQNTPQQVMELPDLKLRFIEADSDTAKFDLTLDMNETDQGLFGEFEYNTDLFEAATIDRLIEHFQVLLAGFVADPQPQLADLPLLTEAEQQQLLIEWNDTRSEHLQTGFVHEWFEAQAERTPDAIAIVFQDQQLTYRELNRRANQLARHLQSLGVGPEVPVGIGLEPSPEAVLSLLAVFKAGGVYVPLDPAYPQERLNFIFDDAQCAILVTESQPYPRPKVRHAGHIVYLDQDWRVIADQGNANLPVEFAAENLAYLIYTSGSTGRPKGVAICQGAIADQCRYVQQAYRLTPDDRVLQFASFSFDASLEQILPALAAGATLVLRDADLWPPADFYARAWDLGLTAIDLAPAYWQATLQEWIQARNPLRKTFIRLVISGGDVLPPESLALWRQTPLQTVPLLNVYGPTETTITATAYAVPVDGAEDRSLKRVSIGRPVANHCIYILDQHGNPVPIGVVGELYIGGSGLARGYWNRPELTAERFIPNPFAALGEAGTRLYKTGDLARYRADGNLEFLGRRDFQVKVRGFRIELGEVEAALRAYPQVQEAVVVVRARGEGDADKYLVAYSVPKPGQTLAANALRNYVRERLPAYMTPEKVVILEALPLTPNGKVDRKALPEPDRTGPAEGLVFARDSLERQLTQIWESILDVYPIGVTQNFFELGGHSLLAVRLLARIEKELGTRLPVATLFQGATIEQLAAALRLHDRVSVSASSLVLMQKGDSTGRPLFFVHPVGGNIVCYSDLVRVLPPDQPFYAFQAQGLDGERLPLTRVEDMARCYIELLRSVQPQGPYVLGGWSMGGVVAFEMAQQLQTQNQLVAALLLIDSYAPSDQAEPEPDDLALLAHFALDLGLPIQSVALEPKHLEGLTAIEKLDYVFKQAKHAGIVPADLEMSQLQRLFQVFRCNLQAMQHYAPQVYTGPITLFKAAESLNGSVLAEDLGWGRFTQGSCTVQLTPGNHYTLLRRPQVEALGQHLQDCLRALETSQLAAYAD